MTRARDGCSTESEVSCFLGGDGAAARGSPAACPCFISLSCAKLAIGHDCDDDGGDSDSASCDSQQEWASRADWGAGLQHLMAASALPISVSAAGPAALALGCGGVKRGSGAPGDRAAAKRRADALASVEADYDHKARAGAGGSARLKALRPMRLDLACVDAPRPAAAATPAAPTPSGWTTPADWMDQVEASLSTRAPRGGDDEAEGPVPPAFVCLGVLGAGGWPA
ncbi:MAG: hypothetical protein J3K34DRAFT_1678 [Monoraphidium minutum]|nr:MAG: hypothetical protein J3K34DRAFT_1678 [Monoraphidium minutum]